ncbi:hypothetical protein HGI30_12760 [Paenibacillus albicereus]|uniref:SH3b domain-containing protein n=1 Tax=Paenibacillus albicereus TaxID=2726185 RepID=A0A6H2GY61_9BACL|nr:SH3 domain-containing protein [Paenibacillus albicereus]QJC52345.1 hypothetical protein HGI30_12760 [Paenibacillus albicereus]
MSTRTTRMKLGSAAAWCGLLLALTTACVAGETNDPPPAVPSEATPAIPYEPTPDAPLLQYDNGELELPVEGATGFAPVKLALTSAADAASSPAGSLEPGTAFLILEENGEWWRVSSEDGKTGWLLHRYSFINLPDVIPSIVYDNTNTYAAKFKSSGKSLPDITDQALYPGKTYNARLSRTEYIVPVLYSMSKKIHQAQQKALAEGNSLKIYEGFRPYQVQVAVVDSLTALAARDPLVKAGINTPPWSIRWFIVNGVSNHQMGYGIDLSLVKWETRLERAYGSFAGTEIQGYEEYEMPSPIHELSRASAVFTAGVDSKSETAWKKATYSSSMSEGAMLLQRYCTEAGLTPLASEWWHFNDLQARDQVADRSSNGAFTLQFILSTPPAGGPGALS